MLVFILLVAALWPTTMFPKRPSTPVRCLWEVENSHLAVDSFINTFVSYFTLVGTFVWKLSQFPNRSRVWLRCWGRARVECAMETAARRLLRTKPYTLWPKTKYRAITTLYVLFVAYMELLESFAFTITLLSFTLVWGTLHLTMGSKATYNLRFSQTQLIEAENEMGFGQIFALLLLAQPALAALDALNRIVAPMDLSVPK
ncbi:hypothetical protein PG993_008375 [Apiospora rasikravindrae]|uniref:Uncharacterized protein n=1 Tax=Apiospora rasikravindrae TaxID=990691 RepID=A0ABR1T215_9PEZI